MRNDIEAAMAEADLARSVRWALDHCELGAMPVGGVMLLRAALRAYNESRAALAAPATKPIDRDACAGCNIRGATHDPRCPTLAAPATVDAGAWDAIRSAWRDSRGCPQWGWDDFREAINRRLPLPAAPSSGAVEEARKADPSLAFARRVLIATLIDHNEIVCGDWRIETELDPTNLTERFVFSTPKGETTHDTAEEAVDALLAAERADRGGKGA